MSIQVQNQYEQWPYPNISKWARVPRDQVWQLNLTWLRGSLGLPEIEQNKPKIWIAGCGTFQSYVWSQANPNASILATDISQQSLDISKRRSSWHRQKNISFEIIDLEKKEQYPNEKFDLIECYGVLMCLQDPLAALRNLGERLSENGVIRLMVYPHYSRQMIFHVQRLARLLDLSFTDSKAPVKLKNLMRRLPKNHPLRLTFFSYGDTAFKEGIVDAFLHASDRGFTGLELIQLVQDAGLNVSGCFQRPWAQPHIMASKIGLSNQNHALILHYLDLWQELRTNFTLLLTKKDLKNKSGNVKNIKNPIFDIKSRDLGLRDKGRLARLALTGGTLQSKIHNGPLNLSGKKFRCLINGVDKNDFLRSGYNGFRSIYKDHNLNIKPSLSFLPGSGRHPMYDHLYDALSFSSRLKKEGVTFPDLKEQYRNWSLYHQNEGSEPLPFSPEIIIHNMNNGIVWEDSHELSSWEDCTLVQENKKMLDLKRFLKHTPFRLEGKSQADLRKIWLLLLGWEYRDDLFL